jgi:hypothetical protein
MPPENMKSQRRLGDGNGCSGCRACRSIRQ